MTRPNRHAAAKRIDPETAIVWFQYGEIGDPYGEHQLDSEWECLGRNYFAADPVERIAVWFGDLSEQVAEALEEQRQEVQRQGWEVILRGPPPAGNVAG